MWKNQVGVGCEHIIYDVDGMKRPIIEKYLEVEKQLINIFKESEYIETFEFEDMYVHDDYVVCATFEYPKDIFKFKKHLEESVPCVSVRFVEGQVEDAIHVDDIELAVDFLINLKMMK